MSNEVKSYFQQRGIAHRTTVAYNPESNGVAERLNRTIMETSEAMRFHAHLPPEFLSLLVFHAVYLLNRRPHSSLKGKTPFEVWWGHPTLLSLTFVSRAATRGYSHPKRHDLLNRLIHVVEFLSDMPPLRRRTAFWTLS